MQNSVCDMCSSLAHSAFSAKIDFWLHKLISLTQSAFFCKKAVECGEYIYVVGFGGMGFVQFFFMSNFIGCKNQLSSKSIVAPQNRAEHPVQRTVCHVPFRGIFALENIFPFRQPVLVATFR